MYNGIRVYKGQSLAEKTAILPSQVREKMQYMMARDEHCTINGASILLAELCGVLLGCDRARTLHRKRVIPT